MTITVSIPRSILSPMPLITIAIIEIMTTDGSHISQETSFDFVFDSATFPLVEMVLRRLFTISFDQILIY